MQNTSNTFPNALITNNELTPIEKYNAAVIANLKKHPLTLLDQHTIKIFNDNCQRNKLSDEKYNIEVDKFNKHHGLLITKKVIDTLSSKYDTGAYYNYINYPYINGESFKLAMKNYRSEVKRYNDGLIEINNNINSYNQKISKKLTTDQLVNVSNFKKQHNKLFTKTYNIEVEKYNAANGPIIAKKRFQKVKFQSELVFQVLLGFYSKQLKQRNAYLLNRNLPTSVEKSKLPALKINYYNLVNHKIDGFQRLDMTKKTAQNHVKRLREAGIINNYLFISPQKPVKCTISSKILVVLDGNLPKSLKTENQLFTDKQSKDLHKRSDTTSAIILNKDKIKDSATSCKDLIRSLTSQTHNACLADAYKNTQKIISEKKEAGPKKHQKRSENLRKLLIEPHILAQQLANNEFINHIPLRYDRLKSEDQYGNLTREEFKQLVIYDIFKSANKLYKNHTVFAGEWTKTIKKALDEWFINNDFILHKATIINKLYQYRWMIEEARKLLLKDRYKDFNLLYPYQYFNKTRTLSKECGFFGLEKHYLKNENIKLKKLETKKLENRENNLRKERLTYQQRSEKKIKQFLNGKCNELELYNYIQDNLPHSWLEQLPSLIKKLAA